MDTQHVRARAEMDCLELYTMMVLSICGTDMMLFTDIQIILDNSDAVNATVHGRRSAHSIM